MLIGEKTRDQGGIFFNYRERDACRVAPILKRRVIIKERKGEGRNFSKAGFSDCIVSRNDPRSGFAGTKKKKKKEAASCGGLLAYMRRYRVEKGQSLGVDSFLSR